MLTTPIAFLTTADPENAREFYASTLGLEFIADEPFALVFRLGAFKLRVQKVDAFAPATHTVFGWEVEDMAAAINALRDNGVVFERFAQIEQDDDGVWSSPSGARIAWFKDPDGNLLSLTQAA